jgi:uncharacterized membrane protein
MARKSVFCIAPSRAQVERITNQLTTVGFSGNDISVLFPDKAGIDDFAHEQRAKAAEGAANGAGMGSVLGGGLGWLVDIGTLTIPGVGPFVAAGPIMVALAGAPTGGITAVLVGFGMPDDQAKQYEGKICKGNVLISIDAKDGKEVDKAKEIFKREGATDISHTEEECIDAAAPKHSRATSNEHGSPECL